MGERVGMCMRGVGWVRVLHHRLLLDLLAGAWEFRVVIQILRVFLKQEACFYSLEKNWYFDPEERK